MSVTLKMADQDARLVAEILADVARYCGGTMRREEVTPILRRLENRVSSAENVSRVVEIAGAFNTSVRANER